MVKKMKRFNCYERGKKMCKCKEENVKGGCHGDNKVFWIDYILASLEDISVAKHNT